MPLRAKFYIALVLSIGTAALASQLTQFHSFNARTFWLYFTVTVLTSGLKVRLPTAFATLSVNFIFFLVGIVIFSLPEAMILTASGCVVQCLWRPRVRPRLIQIAFSVSSLCLATYTAYFTYHGPLSKLLGEIHPLRLGVAALLYYCVNTMLIAGVIALTGGKSILKTWRESYFWSLQYQMVGAAVAWLIVVLNHQESWHAALFLFPMVYWIYRVYRSYLDRLEKDKKHVEELAGLHLRTIEALALAIEAKDATTHQHLQRVRVYATEIGKEVGLDASELEALQAAALLHDIGKLAVPEHIISKPGKLTPEEFEKMKIHPVVGAEILEEVKFPYPVVPIVRAHHEKWDGSGYPYGLAGEEIPIGARILSVVDCFDALASDRQYRRAMPLDKAMEIVVSESGKSFDPAIVQIIRSRYVALEKKALSTGGEKIKLSMDVKIARGLAPATGFAESAESLLPAGDQPVLDSLSSVAAATQDVQMLFELTQDVGSALGLQEALAFVSLRLKRLIPHETIAIYIRRGDKLVAEHVSGENMRLFAALEIPVGQGLSGWVLENDKPILNGNPSVEAGCLNDPTRYSTLRSALAAPLTGVNGSVGVLALYRAEKDAFSKENLRVLIAVSSKVALAIENALQHRFTETSATTDFLTGLPNARSLFVTLDSEVSKAQRGSPGALAVVVCDLDRFRQVNDRFGHLTGDRVLRAVGSGLLERCDPSDYVARMGGDEFVMVIRGGDERSLERKMEAIRAVVRKASEITPEPTSLSLSMGIAHYPADGKDAEALLAEADRRMYTSKRLRRKAGVVIDLPLVQQTTVVAAAVS